MLQFVQSVPETVFATGHAHKAIYKKAGDNDQIVTVVKFCNGTIATVDLSRNSSYGYDQRMEIFTNNGMLQSENQRTSAIIESTGAQTSLSPILLGLETGNKGRYGDAYRLE